MADRECAAWGATQRDAQISADETFYYANACLQHANLNEDEWLALERWIMELNIVKSKKLTVFTGPVFGDTPRIVTPTGRPQAIVPAAFFKVVCFINQTSGQLDVRAFLVFQDTDALKDISGRKTFNYTKYQVTITEIEKLTGIRFDRAVYDANPLLFRKNKVAGRKLNVWSFPARIDINSPADIIDHGDTRVHVARRRGGGLHRLRPRQASRQRSRRVGVDRQLRIETRAGCRVETQRPCGQFRDARRSDPGGWNAGVARARFAADKTARHRGCAHHARRRRQSHRSG